jgi:hypothetical protein
VDSNKKVSIEINYHNLKTGKISNVNESSLNYTPFNFFVIITFL